MPFSSLVKKKPVVRKRTFLRSSNYTRSNQFGSWLLPSSNSWKSTFCCSDFLCSSLVSNLGTYLLFNAGITVFLQILKKNKRYYYQPNNMISVSISFFVWRKMLLDLATIAILSTMVLVTMSAATSIFKGSETFKKAHESTWFWNYRAECWKEGT